MTMIFEERFLKKVKKHGALKKQIMAKVRLLERHPEIGEPLKGNMRGYYSSQVKKRFIIIYLYCTNCRARGDDAFVACPDCADCADETLKFVNFGPHDDAYGLK